MKEITHFLLSAALFFFTFSSFASTDTISFNSEDGVVIVPFAQIDAVIAQLDNVRAAEAKREAEVKNGLVAPDGIKALMRSTQTQRT